MEVKNKIMQANTDRHRAIVCKKEVDVFFIIITWNGASHKRSGVSRVISHLSKLWRVTFLKVPRNNPYRKSVRKERGE